jgi:FtsH-binding integral membrane protein
MKHGEKVAPVMAAVTSVATLACCLPMGFAAAAVTASLSMAVAAYQPWFLGASVVLLLVGGVQLRQTQRTCGTRAHSSLIVFGTSAVIVVLVVLFPDVIAGLLADWLP